MTKLVNRAKMTTATTGTGTITLGSAVDGYQTFADAGVANADVVRYVIEDGDAWEIGLGTYTASGTTLTRGSIESSDSDNALNLTGNAVVYVSAAAADLQELVDFADNFVLPTADGSTGQALTTNGAGTLSFTTITGYTDAAVDAHLNTSTASSGEVLSWTGSDYDWITAGGAFSTIGTRNLAALTALPDLTTGTDNFVAGNLAGDNLTSGSNNVAIGNGALDAATTGGQNIAIGTDAMGIGVATAASAYNTAIGLSAAAYLTTGTENVALGPYALGGDITTNPVKNIAIGRQAGRFAKGTRNIGIGEDGLYGNSSSGLSGADNIGIGYQTGFDLSTGANNFLGGYRAGYDLTTGSNNVAIGNGALDAATTGGRNIAIGQDAMGLGVATEASGDNVAIGYRAGYDLTSAAGNVLSGKESGTNLTTGGYNVASGWNSLQLCSTGGGNVAIGASAFLSSNASNGVAIGANAGRNVTGASNTIVGMNAGYISPELTSGTNNTLIGYEATASSATASNEITLGNSSITRFRVPGAGIDNTSAALSGTTPSVDVGARDTYTLTTSGNTTFTFTGVPSSGQVGTFSLIITAGGTHTLTWPASVDWAGGSAPDAPASGEVDVYTFMTVDGGTQWFGFLAGDAMS